MFYCPHEPQLAWDFIHVTTFPWVFAAILSINFPTAVLLNISNHSSNSNTVVLSAVVGLLVSYQILADHYSFRAGLCFDMVHGHSYDLFKFPSDNDCVGKVRGHWKMD